jgi:hypothetical protein
MSDAHDTMQINDLLTYYRPCNHLNRGKCDLIHRIRKWKQGQVEEDVITFSSAWGLESHSR